MTPHWDTSCIDWRERIVARQSLIPGGPLFPDEAAAALEVFKSLQVVDLAQFEDPATGEMRHPTFGEVSEQFVFDFVSAVFGAYDAGSATRLIEEFFLLISKKNGKSTIVAGIMLTALIRNWRHSAELLILAPTREVADNSFKPAADMVNADADLRDLLSVQTNLKMITHRVTGAVLKVVSADSSTSAGKKAAFVLVEELWLFGKKANASAMLQEATGGLISRPEGFVIYVTTQSDEPPRGVFKEKLDYARDVRDGKIHDNRFLPVLYEFPEDMIESKAYLDPANYYVTNPNIGRSVRKEWLERKLGSVESGTDEDGDSIQTFLAKHLNVEIGMNLRANRWPGAEFWAAAADPSITFESILERCEVAIVGIDGGGLDDLFGFTLIGRERDTKIWLSWSKAWCHKSVLKRRKSIASKLEDLAKTGDLKIVTDKLDDLTDIVALIERVDEAELLACVALDIEGPYGELVDALALAGITEEGGQIVGVGQGYRLMNAIKTTERKLANGTFKHAPSHLMDWCVGNLKIEPTATAIRATKQNAGDAKIDPAMALFDAASVMTTNPQAKSQRSAYENRPLLIV